MSPPKSHEAAVEDFIHAISLLLRRIRSDAPPEHREFSLTQKAVMKRLETEGPATIADLARAEGVKPQSMGTAIANLEDMGLVQRKPHPSDGRQMNILLTAKGLTVRQKTQELRNGWIVGALAKLDKEDRETVLKAGTILKDMVENFS